MQQEILPPERTKPGQLAREAEAGGRHGSATRDSWAEGRFRLPVGIALGLVFSVLLVLICGIIITYMAGADRRIAGRLLDEQGVALLRGHEAVLDGFFEEQQLLFRSIAARAGDVDRPVGDADLEPFARLMPDGARLELGRAVLTENPPDELPELAWSDFETRRGFDTAVMTAEMDLGNGQLLTGLYPQPVFAGLAGEMAFEERQQIFILSGRAHAIAIDGLPQGDFAATADQPLPELTSLTATPLHLLWAPDDRSHDMGGSVSGRVFPGDEGMFTAIYTEVTSGPAKGWILGTLYRAEQFGAALDQTRIVLYAALVALVAGAFLSFVVGRMLGRPLIRLAHAAACLHRLEFETTAKLPRSRLKELDEVNQAFNGSIGALSAFARYVPRQLVSRLIEEGMTDARNIELKEMTIVFVDLAGFTGMASHLSAEETAAYLNGYFETVSQAISEGEGTIDKFLGDGVMAFWGAPSDQPDHAAMAIRAVQRLADRISRSPDINLRVRIGVHTGKVVVGDIGSEARMNYTVIGDAVNVAARLQEYGKQVDPEAKVIALASGDTMARLPEGMNATSLGPVALRGRTEALSVFRIA